MLNRIDVNSNPINSIDPEGLLQEDIDYVTEYIGLNFFKYNLTGVKILCATSGGSYANYPNEIIIDKKYCDECLSNNELRDLLMSIVHESLHLDDMKGLNSIERDIYAWDMRLQDWGYEGIWSNRHNEIYSEAAKASQISHWDLVNNRPEQECCKQ